MKRRYSIVSGDVICAVGTFRGLMLLVHIPFIILISCGPSAQERARLQKERDDSIRIATETATKARLERIAELEGTIGDLSSQRAGLENRLMLLKSDLEVARDKMSSIKQVQFLRTPAEREEQIREQSLVIQNLELEVSELPTRLGSVVQDIEAATKELNSLKAN